MMELNVLKPYKKLKEAEIDRLLYSLGACPDWREMEIGRLTEEEIAIVEIQQMDKKQ
jgi:hypothetical protein